MSLRVFRIGTRLPLAPSRACEQRSMIVSGAPLTRSRCLDRFPTNTDMLFLSLENSYVAKRGVFCSYQVLAMWRRSSVALFRLGRFQETSGVPTFSTKT